MDAEKVQMSADVHIIKPLRSFHDLLRDLTTLRLSGCAMPCLGTPGAFLSMAALLAQSTVLHTLVIKNVAPSDSEAHTLEIANENMMDIAVKGVLRSNSLLRVEIGVLCMTKVTSDAFASCVGYAGTVNQPICYGNWNAVSSLCVALKIFPNGFSGLTVNHNCKDDEAAFRHEFELVQLFELLATQPISLQRLHIHNLSVMDCAAYAVGRMIASNNQLEHLSFGGVSWWSSGACLTMVDGICSNTQLQHLDFSEMEGGWNPNMGCISRLMWNRAHGAASQLTISGIDWTKYPKCVPLAWLSDPEAGMRQDALRIDQGKTATLPFLWASENRYMPSWSDLDAEMPIFVDTIELGLIY
jgi:hypothetical protein